VSPLIARERVWAAPPGLLPAHCWPSGACRIAFDYDVPKSPPEKELGILVRGGWEDAFEFFLLKDGRLEVRRTSLPYAPTSRSFAAPRPLPAGRTVHVELVYDWRTVSVKVDGETVVSAPLDPIRVHGNCRARVGAGVRNLVINGLESGNRDLPEMVRARAARVLLADDPAKLPSVLADPSRRVREAAFGYGLKIPAERFAAALKGASPELTRALVARLVQDGAKAQVGAIAACAEGSDDETAAAIARALGALGGAAEVCVLETLRARGGVVEAAAEEALCDMAGIGELVFARAEQDPAWLGIAAKRAERKLLGRWRPFIAHADPKVRKAAWKAFGKMIDESTFAEASRWYAEVKEPEAETAAHALWRVVKERGEKRNEALIALWRRATPAGRPAVEGLVNRANALGAFDVWMKVVEAGGADAAAAKRAYVALADQTLAGAETVAAETSREKWSATASRNGDRVRRAFDGDPATRWETGWKPKGQWFALDLGGSFFVESVTLDAGKSPNDTPKGCDVYVSRNGVDWTGPVATCDDKTVGKTEFAVARGARHLKFVARGENPSFFWSIHEIAVKTGVDRGWVERVRTAAAKFRGEVK